jgi:hypothetical protein
MTKLIVAFLKFANAPKIVKDSTSAEEYWNNKQQRILKEDLHKLQYLSIITAVV